MQVHKALLAVSMSAFAALSSVAVAAPAVADTPASGTVEAAAWWKHRMYTEDSRPGAVVKFQPNGDRVQLCDDQEDGWAADLTVRDKTEGGRLVYAHQVGGYNNCIEFRAALGGKYNLAEGHTFTFRICLDKAGRDPSFCDWADWRNVN